MQSPKCLKIKDLLAKLKGELEHKPTQVTTINVGAKIDAWVRGEPPQIAEFIADNGRLPTAEERQHLLPEGDNCKTGEPLEKG